MLHRFPIFLLVAILLSIVLVACAGAPASPLAPTPASTSAPTVIPQLSVTPIPTTTTSPTPAVSPESTTIPIMSPIEIPTELQPYAESAIQIAAEALGVDPDDVTILSIQSATGRNSSLGCPKPGFMYLQVITPGYLVKVEVAGQQHEVHMNERGHGVLCTSNQIKQIPGSGDTGK